MFNKILWRKREEDISEIESKNWNDTDTTATNITTSNMIQKMKKNKKKNLMFSKNQTIEECMKNYNEKERSKTMECTIKLLVYCQNYIKKESCYQTFIEPIRIEMDFIKKSIDAPINIYTHFSWINVNFNVNLLDNIFSLCCSVILSMVSQRTRLMLGRGINEVEAQKNNTKIASYGQRSERNEDPAQKNNKINATNINSGANCEGTLVNGQNKTVSVYPSLYNDMVTEKKNISEMDDTLTFTYFPNYESVFNDEMYKDFILMTKENFLIRYNKFDVLNAVNKSLDIYICGEIILAKLLKNYQYSCQYPGDYVENYENEVSAENKNSVSQKTLKNFFFHYVKKKKRQDMTSITKINNLLGQPIAILTIKKKTIYTEPVKIEKQRPQRKKAKEKDEVNKKREDKEKRKPFNGDTIKITKKRQNSIYSNESIYNSRKKKKTLNMNKTFKNNFKESVKYQWNIIDNNESFDLPTYKNGNVQFFIIRFRLLNYIYDIPSHILNTKQENEEVLRIVIPERKLPVYLNKKSDASLGSDEYLDMEKFNFLGNDKTLYPSNYHNRSVNNNSSHEKMNSPNGGNIKNRNDYWVASHIPQPRNHLYIYFRTKIKMIHDEKQECDFFISSIIAVKNNTDFPLYVFKSVPGNVKQNGIFREYFNKFDMKPSPPPTYTLNIGKKLEKMIEHNFNTNDTSEMNEWQLKETNQNLFRDKMLSNIDEIVFTKTDHSRIKNHYTKNENNLYNRKSLKNVLPLMKLSATEHYISGDIKFSTLAPMKFKKKQRKTHNTSYRKLYKKTMLKRLLNKKNIENGEKHRFKENQIKRNKKKKKYKMRRNVSDISNSSNSSNISNWTSASKRYAARFSNQKKTSSLSYSNEANTKIPLKKLTKHIMSMNDPFFSFLKKSDDIIDKKTNSFYSTHENRERRSYSVDSYPESLLSSSENSSYSSSYEDSIYAYDKNNSAEQTLLNEYYVKQNETYKKKKEFISYDFIELESNSAKMIPIPLYWIVAENAFIWICIQTEKKSKKSLYDFLSKEKNADYLCNKNTLDNILSYKSPFLSESGKFFKPYLINLRNHLLKEKKIEENNLKEMRDRLTNYNLNYMNLKNVYFASYIVSVYNQKDVLNKKHAHNFYQINIEHGLMINNGLPKTIYLTYEVMKGSSQKKKYMETSIYPFENKTIKNFDEIDTFSDFSSDKWEELSEEEEDANKDEKENEKEDEENNKFNIFSKFRKKKTSENILNYKSASKNKKQKRELIGLKNIEKDKSFFGNSNCIIQEEKLKENEQISDKKKKLQVHIYDEDQIKRQKKGSNKIEKEERKFEVKEKDFLMKEVKSGKNIFIYKNVNCVNDNDKKNDDSFENEEINFTVNIKKKKEKNIYEIKIHPGQNIKIPFFPNIVNISFDGYNSKNIHISYPHKKGREKVILEKVIVFDEDNSFFTFDNMDEENKNPTKTETGKNIESDFIEKDSMIHASPNNMNALKKNMLNDKELEIYAKNEQAKSFKKLENIANIDEINNRNITLYEDNNNASNSIDDKNSIFLEASHTTSTFLKTKSDHINQTEVQNQEQKCYRKCLYKFNKVKTYKYDEFQKKLTIWAYFNEFYEIDKSRNQNIYLAKIFHGTFSVSCTFFASAWIINRLNYPIKLKRLDNENVLSIEPYKRKLLPCEFVTKRNKVIISYDTLKEIQHWNKYPLKKNLIRENKLKKKKKKKKK